MVSFSSLGFEARECQSSLSAPNIRSRSRGKPGRRLQRTALRPCSAVIPFAPIAPRPLTEVIPEYSAGPIAALRGAITGGSGTDFVAAYEALTEGCNRCHIAVNFSFNVVTRPTGNPFSNQVFDVVR